MKDLILDSIKSFNPDSKLWIFQSIEPLDESEVVFVSKSLETISFFLDFTWKKNKQQKLCN